MCVVNAFEEQYNMTIITESEDLRGNMK